MRRDSAEGERRHAAVLVSLVSEYVSLVERLNASKLEELMRRVHAAATESPNATAAS